MCLMCFAEWMTSCNDHIAIVPDMTAQLPMLTGIVERIWPPGAEIAGLKSISAFGPHPLKYDTSPASVFGNSMLESSWGNVTVKLPFCACSVICESA